MMAKVQRIKRKGSKSNLLKYQICPPNDTLIVQCDLINFYRKPVFYMNNYDIQHIYTRIHGKLPKCSPISILMFTQISSFYPFWNLDTKIR